MKKQIIISLVIASCILAISLAGCSSIQIDPDVAYWTNVSTIETTGDVGYYASLALNVSGYGRVSYYDSTNKKMKYASWNASSWDLETIQSTDSSTKGNLALDSNGDPHVAYVSYDSNGTTVLKHAQKSNGTWSYTSIASLSSSSEGTSDIKVDSSNIPHVCFIDQSVLKYAVKSGTSWTVTTIDSASTCAVSLDIDQNNQPKIARVKLEITSEIITSEVDYFSYTLGAWTYEAVAIGHFISGESQGLLYARPFLCIDGNNKPHLAVTEGFLWYDIYYFSKSTTWSSEKLEAGESLAGIFLGLAVDSNNYPGIAFFRNNKGIKYTKKNSNNTWSTEYVDPVGTTFLASPYISLAFNASNVPYIAYEDTYNKNIKYAHK